ncbi:hypothetical protein Q3G72_015602 [Acer saccharum]|nr:hypothetical protein Q3G72_015602 [Acer saccharum]
MFHALWGCKLLAKVESVAPLGLATVVPKWRPPLVGFWKINTDVALCSKERLIGLGVIIRDNLSLVKLASAQKMIEYDSLQVVDLISKGSPSDADVGLIVAEILIALQSLPSCSINHVPRLGNTTAHVLAKKALSIESEYRWLDFCPPCMERIIKIDALF